MAQETLDPEMTAALDKLFNAWLALNGLLSKGGVLYRADDQGEILLASDGRQVIVDPNFFEALINDPEKGYQAFAAKKGVRIQLAYQPFPDE